MFAGDGSFVTRSPCHFKTPASQTIIDHNLLVAHYVCIYTKPLDGTEDETRRSVWGSRHVGWLLGLGRRALRPRAYRQLITLRTDVSHVIKKHCARFGTSSFSDRLPTLFFPLLHSLVYFPTGSKKSLWISRILVSIPHAVELLRRALLHPS